MMSQFEFIFSLYSLLLGLSLVELLSGLGRTVKDGCTSMKKPRLPTGLAG
jgi:hypothetical protein